MAAHKHAEVIKAWADGALIQFKDGDCPWRDCPQPSWHPLMEWRIKPAEQERVYPETRMTPSELSAARYPFEKFYWDKAVANAALRHAIDAGQVLTPEALDKMCGDRRGRDLEMIQLGLDSAERHLSISKLSTTAILYAYNEERK